MMLHTILDYILANRMEFAGFITTAVAIWLTTRRNMLCWPITLVAAVVYLTVFFHSKLYSDALLQCFFLSLTLYGWWHWWRGARAAGEVRVEPLRPRPMLIAIALGVVGSFLLGWIMTHLGAALPYRDATLASFSLVASWWQARKHIANWWLWIVVDFFYVGMYINKSLYITAVLYSVLAMLAVLGIRDWSRAAAKTVQAQTAA
jgi:nicotinamide mononucleotide transporter